MKNRSYVCTVKDCDGYADKRNLCSKHYQRYRHRGDPLNCGRRHFLSLKTPNELKKFLKENMREKIHPILGTPCWIWTGKCFSNGYGRLQVDSKPISPHRASAIIFLGFKHSDRRLIFTNATTRPVLILSIYLWGQERKTWKTCSKKGETNAVGKTIITQS